MYLIHRFNSFNNINTHIIIILPLFNILSAIGFISKRNSVDVDDDDEAVVGFAEVTDGSGFFNFYTV
ncbi:unnamed protein product [Rhizophagus irregularis]|nr:unnamed protein product [Rhizophagus irregularis]